MSRDHFASYYKECPVCFNWWGRPHYSKQGVCEHFNCYGGAWRRCRGSDIQWKTWNPYTKQSTPKHDRWIQEMELKAPSEWDPRFPTRTQARPDD